MNVRAIWPHDSDLFSENYFIWMCACVTLTDFLSSYLVIVITLLIETKYDHNIDNNNDRERCVTKRTTPTYTNYTVVD